MMICEYSPLKQMTTFQIGGLARYVVEACYEHDIVEALQFVRQKRLNLAILGGGSNVLFSDRGFSGLVLRPGLKGVEVIKEDAAHVWLSVAAGEIWDDVVSRTIEAGWWGIENLSCIPGHAGALAIQNVGAYGQEAQDVIESVEVYEIAAGKRAAFTAQQCQFGYRASVFNTSFQGKYLILSVVLRLKKYGVPTLEYRDLQEYFGQEKKPTLQEIRSAVIAIRRKKLPDPVHIGNAGSFFKNVLLNAAEFEAFYQKASTRLGSQAAIKVEKLRSFSGTGERNIKIPTALILDICRVKDFRVGEAAVYPSHPLILINATGHATAHDVLSLMRKIRSQVYQDTGIILLVEPSLFGFETEELQAYFSLNPFQSDALPTQIYS